MSKPIPRINRYKADLREMNFLLFEQFKIQDLLGKDPYKDWDQAQISEVLKECYKWVREVEGPLNATGDAEGCKLENGKVTTPQGFKPAWKSLYEAGWKMLAGSPEYDGGGAPRALQVVTEEMISGGNVAFSMYAGLTAGAADVIERFGNEAQKKLFCHNMFHGKWGGTMCITEPHAGTDVGSAKTKATRNADGTFNIKGTKIFISAGDHDLTDNIIHLVLARVEGAPAGTKGLTLFVVPKLRVSADGKVGESNDVAVGNIEHKMGINGSATCVLNFGENDKCIGVPVGGEDKINQGMSQMFLMMNSARIAVGLQGLSVASSAYLNALEYAKERKQGASMLHWKDATAPRVALIEHGDIRRMLMDMKSKVEGIRALAVMLACHMDNYAALIGKDDTKANYHLSQVDLLVPLVKAYGSDQGFRVCETAIQTYGGAGYTRDYPVEQYCRDAKIFSIYEGTNHIQAMDLVGRKLGQNGGANLQAFLGDVAAFVAKHAEHKVFSAEVKRLGQAQEAVMQQALRFLGWFQGGKVGIVPLAANRFLEMMAELSVAWMLLDGAIIAQDKLANAGADENFYKGKIAAAQYYARNILPGVMDKARVLESEDTSAIDIPDAGFATV